MGHETHNTVKASLPSEIVGVALVDSKGRISLPARARTKLGIQPGDNLAVIVARTEIRLIPTRHIPIGKQ